MACSVAAGVLVVQRVLAGHERRSVQQRGVVAAVDGGDELAERGRAEGIAPREVVQQGDPIGVGADGDDVADRLVDHGVGHRLGVVEAVPRVDADADGQPVGVPGVAEHDAVAGAVALAADERADDGAATDLVVVAVDRRCLRRDVRVGQQRQQRRRRVGDVAAGRLARGPRDVGDQLPAGPAVVEERRVEVEDDVPAVAHDEPAVAGERAEVGQLDAVPGAPLAQLGEAVGRDGHDHPLLGLREPDLPWLQAGVLERDDRQLDVGADALGHLPDRRREAAGPAVGDRRPEVVGAGEHVDQPLLGDRIADLHAGAGDVAGRGVHRQAGERGPADAVATGAPAEHDDPVTRVRSRRRRAVGGDADAPAEDERVGREAGVVEDRAGDGREADLVAVVGDAVDHAVADPAGVQRAVGQLVDRELGGSEAQHVGHGDRPVAGTHHVADDAADARVGAAERLDGRRVVVGLGLHGDRRALGERHDAGVADEGRADERGGDGIGGRPQAVEQAGQLLARGRREGGPERLVRAVLAPRLGQRLELDVGGIATGGAEVALDGLQLGRVEGQRPLDAQPAERVGVEIADGDRRGDRRACPCRGAGRAAPGRRSSVRRWGWRRGGATARRPSTDPCRGPARGAGRSPRRRPRSPSCSAACTTASAAVSVTPGWRAISTAGSPWSGTLQVPVCSSGSARNDPRSASSSSSRSPSTNTMSATSTGPASVNPSVAAPAVMAVARGSVSTERTVNRCVGRGPDTTGPTLGTRHAAP